MHIAIVSPDRRSHHVIVAETAVSPDELSRGLRGRWPLTPMLLVLPRAEMRDLAMDGVLGALDVAFANDSGDVLAVYASLPPGAARIAAPCTWRYALELPAGEARKAGLVVGSRLVRV